MVNILSIFVIWKIVVVIWYSLFYFIICIFDVLTLTNQKGRNYQYINLKPSPACICGHGFEDCIHFFLECPFYNENRAILLNKLKNYVVTIELILAGDENLTPNQNIEIFSAVYSIIRSTHHFNSYTSLLTPIHVVFCCFCLFETFLFLPIPMFWTFYFTLFFFRFTLLLTSKYIML